MSEVPTYGGSFSEGIIGTPRFVNPILSISDADRDLTILVYSGLLRKTADGGYITDLASKYEISKDGLTYTFTLRNNLTFHDGTPLTTDDVEFTIQKAKDPLIKSPKRPNWEGVSVQKIDDRTISFTLVQPYAQFLENVTLGVLPKGLWKDLPAEQWSFSEYNIKGIGSGPYMVESVSKNRAGIPVSYELSSFKKFALGRPYIDSLPLEKRGVQIKKYPLPRVYGIFFNQSSAPVLSDYPVRKALNEAVDRMDIVNAVLYGFGTPLYGPIPKLEPITLRSTQTEETADSRVAEAQKILTNNGWKFSTSTGQMNKTTKKETQSLAFSISTVDKPELKAVAEILKSQWEKLGARIEIKIFEPGDLNQNVIRPRKYDALLFGEIVGENSDPYAFWHSSQRNDPGLNIALYANSKVDKILEDTRGILDAAERSRKYEQFEKYVNEDIPAVFIYSPDFIYLVSPDLKGMEIGQLTVPAERFINVNTWYEDTDRIWKIFTKKKELEIIE